MFNRSPALAKADFICPPQRGNKSSSSSATSNRLLIAARPLALYSAILIGHLWAVSAAPAAAQNTSAWSSSRATFGLLDWPHNGGGHLLNSDPSVGRKIPSFRDPADDEETNDSLGAKWLAESRGFALEAHKVTTQDGYILTVHRLVNPLVGGGAGNEGQRRTAADPRGPPVILQHGILCASPFFLMNSSPEQDRPRRRLSTSKTNAHDNSSVTITSNSLAFELAQRGHDVWLPNFRGTQYSRGHLSAELDEGGSRRAAYWEFNVDTLVEQDLRACVEYVLELTGSGRYMFIGHSLGATVGLGSLLVHSDTRIVSHLSCAILMAPVASTQFMRGRLLSLFKTATMLYRQPGPFPGATRTFSAFVRRICPRLRQLCLWLASMFIGTKRSAASEHATSNLNASAWTAANASSGQISPGNQTDDGDGGGGGGDHDGSEFQKQVNTFLMMMRQSVSVQMLEHIVQVHFSGRLSRFNYGRHTNELRYGNALAPIYDLTKISQPKLSLAIVSGQSDAISTPGEIDWISEQVRDKVGHFEQITVPVSPFNHMDLIMSSEAGKFVNKRMLEFIHRNKCLAAGASSG